MKLFKPTHCLAFLGLVALPAMLLGEPATDDLDEKLGIEGGEDQKGLDTPSGLPDESAEPSLPDKGLYTIELVTWDDPQTPVDAAAEERRFDNYQTVVYWIPDIRLNDLLVTPPDSKFLEDIGLVLSLRARRKTDLDDGLYHFKPGNASFEVKGDKIIPRSDAVIVKDDTVRLRLVPITFESTNADRTQWAPFGMTLHADNVNLLERFRKVGPPLVKSSFYRLTLFLPAGQDYVSSWAKFRINEKGEVQADKLPPGVRLTGRGFHWTREGEKLAVARPGWFEVECSKVRVIGPLLWHPGESAVLVFGVGSMDQPPSATLVPYGRHEPAATLAFEPGKVPEEAGAALRAQGQPTLAFQTRCNASWTGPAQLTVDFQGKKFTRNVALLPKDCPIHLWTRQYRSAYLDNESIECRVVIQGRKSGDLELVLQESEKPDLVLGRFPLDGRPLTTLFATLEAGHFRPGDYRLAARLGEYRSPSLPLFIRSSARKTNLLFSNITICMQGWNEADMAAAARRQAAIGFDMLTRAGHDGYLYPTIGSADPALEAALADHGAPLDYAYIPCQGEQFLDECVRSRIGYIDYISVYKSWYNEGLSFHHTNPPDVDRWIRREQILFGAAALFPAYWGVNYTWFPRLFGYVESGVDTDIHKHDRNRILGEKLDQKGFTPLSREEWDFCVKNLFSEDGEKKARAEALAQRQIGRVRGYGEAFYENFKLYQEHIKEVRPDGIAVAFENAGHDCAAGGNYLPLFYGGLDAATMEAYTDFGDWALEPAFTTDWVRAAMKARPDRQRPFWLTAEWSPPPDIRYGYMLQALGRRVEGASYPFPALWPESMDRAVSHIASFVKAYGSVQPYLEVEPEIAILCSFNQMAFDGRALYAYHAFYYDLTRAQYPPQCIYEETVERGGLRNSGIRLLFVVRQTAPLPAIVLEEIQAFQKAGGIVVADASTTLPMHATHRLSYTCRHIWEEGMGGFEQAHRLALWQQYLQHREELKTLLQKYVHPFAQSEDERIITSTLVGGDVRYVFTVNDNFDPDKPEQQLHVFYRKRDVPLRLQDAQAAVYDLQTLEPLRGESSGDRLSLKLDLFNQPGLILAALPEAIEAITTDAPAQAFLGSAFFARCRLLGRSGKPVAGPTPARFVLRNPAGKERETLFRAAGVDDAACFRLAFHDEPGDWMLEVTDMVSGKQIRSPIQVRAAAEAPRLAKAAGRVLVPREDAARKFLTASDEKLIFLEENQRGLKPLADRLAEALGNAGGRARVIQLDPTRFDEISLRWYPTEREQRQHREVEETRIVGVAHDMRTYIEPKTRRHVVALSGYEGIPPPFIVNRPSIVFGGGRLANSLTCASPYRVTPEDPGPGNAVLDLVFSAFAARKHTLAILASDSQGFEAGVEKALEILRQPGSPPLSDPPPVAGTAVPLPYQLSPVSASYTGSGPTSAESGLKIPEPGPWRQPSKDSISFRHAITEQFKGFFASIVAVNRSGDVLVQPGHGQRRVTISLEGQILGSIEAPKGVFCTRLSDDAQWIFFGLNGDGRIDWMKALDGKPVIAQCSQSGSLRAASLLCPDQGNDYGYGQIQDKTNYFVIGPDSQTLYVTREGGLTAGPIGGPYRLYNHSPQFRDFRETHSPDWPIGMALSSDGKILSMSCWAHPTANSMGGPLFMVAVSPEIVALDGATLDTVWIIAPPKSTTWEQAPFKNCLAINAQGSRVGYVDGLYQLYVVDPSGRAVWNASLLSGPADNNNRTPPDRIEMSEDGNTVLAVYSGLDVAALARPGAEPRVFRPAPAGSALSPDGRFVACSTEGEVKCYASDGKVLWEKKAKGGRAAMAALGLQGFAMIFGDGTVERWSWDGVPAYEVTGEQVAKAAAQPLRPGPDFKVVTSLPSWTVDTLESLKKHCRAKLLGKGSATQPIVSPASGKMLLVHMTYRKPAENPTVTLTLSDGKQREVFHLDLPAGDWRSQDIAWAGRKRPLRAELKAGPGVEIAEFQLWEFEWPSKNLAYVKPAGAETEAADLGLGQESNDADEEGDDSGDLDAEEDLSGQGLYGKMKDAHIRVRNTDPDQIAGPFLPAGDNPLKVLDGRLYASDQTLRWYTGQGKTNPFGLWFELDFGKESEFDLVAFYSHTTRQSEVLRTLGLMAFEGRLGPGQEIHDDRPLGMITDNDQFFRLFALPVSRCKVLRCFLGEVRKEYGLSELEIYRSKARGR